MQNSISPNLHNYPMVPVNEPLIAPHARRYVDECLKTGWISSAGSYITKFEESFAEFTGTKYATTVTNGTAALHLALTSLGIGHGDEVIIPDLTIISCALAVFYTGATPVVVDVDPETGTMNPCKIEAAITKKTKVIMPVHLYGHPADMDPIRLIAIKHHLKILEDAAEAHGALYKGKPVGSLGDVAAYSFFANKIITTGEGGMVVTNSKDIIEKARLLKNLAHSPKRRFLHEEIGFNYRMTNLQAAVGFAALEIAETYINKKLKMAAYYKKSLKDIEYLELPIEKSWAKSVYWMYAVRVSKDSPLDKFTVMRRLKDEFHIDTREYFLPLHIQPVAKKLGLKVPFSCPVSSDLSERGFYIPSGLAITDAQMNQVSGALHSIYSL
jgi:perosamine synthetase